MDKIKKLQRLLKEQGYNIQIDGQWGPKSQEAYSNFQTKQGTSEATSVLNPVTAAYNSLPLNARSLVEDIVVPDMFKQPITEHDLNNRQKKSLQEIVRKNLKEGKTNISYKDYGTSDSDNPYADVDPTGSNTSDLIKKSFTSPEYNLKSTIGQASIIIPPGSNDTLVVDQYNFNDSVSEDMKLIDRIKGYKNEKEGGYGTFRKAGKYFGSKEGKGSPVIINTSEKRKGGIDYYRSGGRRKYVVGGEDASMYNNTIPQGYSPNTAATGSYQTTSSTVGNQMYVPGNEQDLTAQQQALNEAGPDSSEQQADIQGKHQAADMALSAGMSLAGVTSDPIDQVTDQVFNDQDAGTYKWWEVGGDVGTALATGNYIEGIKDIGVKWSQRNKIKRAEERAAEEHEQEINTLATNRDVVKADQRMQSGINYGQDLSTNQQKYARYGGPMKYYTGGRNYIGSTFEDVNVNKNQYDNIQNENDYNVDLYGGQRFTNKWSQGNMQYDSSLGDEGTTMDNKLETILPKEVRLGLNRQDQRGVQFTKPNRPISPDKNNYLSNQSQEHYDRFMSNRNDKLYRKQLNTRNKFQTGLKNAQEVGKEKKFMRNYDRDSRRFEKFGNTESGLRNLLRNTVGKIIPRWGIDMARTDAKFEFGRGYATGGIEEGEKMALNIPGINMANMEKDYPDIVNKLDTLSDKDKMGLMKYIGDTKQSASNIYNDKGKLDIGKTTSWFKDLDTDPLVNYRDTAGISKDEFRNLVQSEVNPEGKWVNEKMINAALGAKGLRSGGRPLPGGKVYDLPSGAKKYVGASHEEGGIDKNPMTEVENGETEENILGKPYIFSSYLKKGGRSYAQMHEDILRNGGSENEKINLAVDQENKAGRDPEKIFMKHGGMHKSKYNTGGALAGMSEEQKRQWFMDNYNFDPLGESNESLTTEGLTDNNDNEIVLDPNNNANKDLYKEDETITENAERDENNKETNKLTWEQQVGKLKSGLSMDNLVAAAHMAPVAKALRNANQVDRLPLPGLTPGVTPNKIQYGNMNKERAQNERDYQKMVNFVQTQGGSLSDQMAAYSKKLDANANVGSQEQDANREVDALNSRAIFEAAKFNATGKSQDIKNKMYVDEFNLASKAASEDATVEAMQVGAENLGVLNKDRKLQDSSDRLSAAIDGGSGVLLREKYGPEEYKRLVEAARSGDVDALRELEESSILLNEEVKQKGTNEEGKAGKY